MTISIVNQKGGTGKTTTTINIGVAIGKLGYDVLLIDLDQQGNLTFSLGITPDYNIVDVFKTNKIDTDKLIYKEGIYILPTDQSLAEYEYSAISRGEEFKKLSGVLKTIEKKFDFIFIDCPPSVSFLVANALTASDSVLIPIQTDILSLQGVDQVITTISEIKETLNEDLSLLGLIPVMVDHRKKLTQEILEHIKNNYETPCFKSQIRTDVKACEAPSFGQSVLSYAPTSRCSTDFKRLASELISKTNNN